MSKLFAEFAADSELRRYWVQALGCQTPPPAEVKCDVLGWYANWTGSRVLVETGTYKGDTVEVLRRHMDMVYSIEASPTLFAAAQQRFAGVKNVKLFHGDSGAMLGEVIKDINQRIIFWLDAHWCGGETHGEVLSAAIMGELEAVLAHPIQEHVIIIDDARYFVGQFGYPSVNFLRKWLLERRPDWTFDVAVDSIRMHKRTMPPLEAATPSVS